jgi:hypothetical protein
MLPVEDPLHRVASGVNRRRKMAGVSDESDVATFRGVLKLRSLEPATAFYRMFVYLAPHTAHHLKCA